MRYYISQQCRSRTARPANAQAAGGSSVRRHRCPCSAWRIRQRTYAGPRQRCSTSRLCNTRAAVEAPGYRGLRAPSPAVRPSGAPPRRSSGTAHIAADGSGCEGVQPNTAHPPAAQSNCASKRARLRPARSSCHTGAGSHSAPRQSAPARRGAAAKSACRHVSASAGWRSTGRVAMPLSWGCSTGAWRGCAQRTQRRALPARQTALQL